MKKTYQSPEILVVKLFGGATCESIIIGSGNSPVGTGNGVDLVKEDNISSSSSSYNVWDDDWSN